MTARATISWSLVILACAASAARAQSLGELARQEEARRQAVSVPARAFTSKDVRAVPTPAPAAAPTSAAPDTAAQPEAQTAAPASAAADATEPTPPAAPPQEPAPAEALPSSVASDETHWRTLHAEARARLERTEAALRAFEQQYEALAARFVALGDASQRAQVIADMEKAQAEIGRLQQEYVAQSQQLTAVEEQARRAGVPPGWIRQPEA